MSHVKHRQSLRSGHWRFWYLTKSVHRNIGDRMMDMGGISPLIGDVEGPWSW